MPDARLARPLWRGRTNVDALTIAAIERAEKIGGHRFEVTQGSYQSGVAASAGTHDRGGAIDLAWCGHVACVRALREAGFAAWHRTPAQGPWKDHIHAVVLGHPDLARAAERQVDAYGRGLNGLADGRQDDGPRVYPIPYPVFPWPAPKAKPSRGARIDAALTLLAAERKAAKRAGQKIRLRRTKAAAKILRAVVRK